MNLDKLINDLSTRIDKFDSSSDNDNELRYWKGRKIISLNEWKKIANYENAFSHGIEDNLQTNEALQYFPEDYSRFLFPLGVQKEFEEKASEWYSDYEELMEHKRNPNYGRTKCFHCLLSPDGDDPIFIGINRLVATGLQKNKNQSQTNPTEYHCSVVNRFECPYDCEKGKVSNTKFDVEDLFELASMAFAVEIALTVARKDTSVIQIKNKEDLYQALTNQEMLDMILEWGLDYILSDKETFDDVSKFEKLQKDNRGKIVDYFINIKDKLKLEELRFY